MKYYVNKYQTPTGQLSPEYLQYQKNKNYSTSTNQGKLKEKETALDGTWFGNLFDKVYNYSNKNYNSLSGAFARAVDGARNLYDDVREGGLSFLPGVGDTVDVVSIGDDVNKGNYGSAALTAVLMALPGSANKAKQLGKKFLNKTGYRKAQKTISKNDIQDKLNLNQAYSKNTEVPVIEGEWELKSQKSPEHQEFKLIPGQEQYKYRAARLGIDPKEYIRGINSLRIPTPEKLELIDPEVGNLIDLKLIDPFAYVNDESVKKGIPEGLIYNYRFSPIYLDMDPSKRKSFYRIIDNHEGTHIRQGFFGDTNKNFEWEMFAQARLNPEQVFHQNGVSDGVYKYLINSEKGNPELIARMGQLKDAIGLKPGEEFTREMFDFLKRNYTKTFGDNNMSDLFKIIKDPDGFVKLMNTKAVKRYASVIPGIALSTKYLTNQDNTQNHEILH